jgi:hypothetical protein
VGNTLSAPGSSDVVVLGDEELGLLRLPRAPLLPTDWGKVTEGVEMVCSQVAIVHRLLCETLAMVDRDILQPARVSKELLRPTFPGSSLYG